MVTSAAAELTWVDRAQGVGAVLIPVVVAFIAYLLSRRQSRSHELVAARLDYYPKSSSTTQRPDVLYDIHRKLEVDLAGRNGGTKKSEDWYSAVGIASGIAILPTTTTR